MCESRAISNDLCRPNDNTNKTADGAIVLWMRRCTQRKPKCSINISHAVLGPSLPHLPYPLPAPSLALLCFLFSMAADSELKKRGATDANSNGKGRHKSRRRVDRIEKKQKHTQYNGQKCEKVRRKKRQ